MCRKKTSMSIAAMTNPSPLCLRLSTHYTQLNALLSSVSSIITGTCLQMKNKIELKGRFQKG